MGNKQLKLLFMAGCLLASIAVSRATPPNSATIDGRIIEYNAGDWTTNYVLGLNGAAEPWGPDNLITNIYITWDEDYVYFAVRGWVAFPSDPSEVPNKIAMLIDVDPGSGTGATTTTNWLSGEDYILYNALGWTGAGDTNDFGFDYMVASEGNSHNLIRVLYDDEAFETNVVESVYDNFNNIFPPDVTIGANLQRVNDSHLHNGFEAKIPWSTIYPTNNTRFGEVIAGQVVPVGAKLRVMANLHNNLRSIDPSGIYSSPVVIPEQGGGASYDNGFMVTDSYFEVLVDQDGNGLPDLGIASDNPPYLKSAVGFQGQNKVYVYFNEDVDTNEATNALRWRVNGTNALLVNVLESNSVELTIDDVLPVNGSWVRIDAENIPDLDGNFQETYQFINPANSGLEQAVSVRFLLNKNSGMGATASGNNYATNFFINGSAAPLEFDFPPAMTSPLSVLNSTQHFHDVTFPPGTPEIVFYKYSGVIRSTGTNTYEAVRLDNFGDISRQLRLPTNGVTSIVVTDWLGAAGAPFRPTTTNAGARSLYLDTRRGDAGVRERTTILFQLDLSGRDLRSVQRVLIQGTDPLRGFNDDYAGFPDYAGFTSVNLSWLTGGIELFDDGTHGDTNALDGIYSRLWSLSEDGTDDQIVPDFPHSLVGGGLSDEPYQGYNWLERRSPRSFKYKYYVYKGGNSALEDPPFDVEYWVDGSTNQIILQPYVWSGSYDDLPLPPPTNAPTMLSTVHSNGEVTVHFEGTDLAHGVQVSSDLSAQPAWLDYGLRATTSAVPNEWYAVVPGASDVEHYRAYSGAPRPNYGPWFEPNDLDETGGVVRVWYSQHQRKFAGVRDVGLTGTITEPDWSDAVPMAFTGDGFWYLDVTISTNDPVLTEVKPRTLSGDWEDGDNLRIYRGPGRATWSPLGPANGETLRIVYDANGGPLAASTNVSVYLGFGDFWSGASSREMTNVLAETNVWEYGIEIPTTTTFSVNFVFNGQVGASTVWDSEGNPGNGGRQYRVFVNKPYALLEE